VSRHTNRRLHAKLDAIYAELPRVACRGLCTVACGAVPMVRAEAARLPQADPRRRLPMVVAETRRCVYLSPVGRCSVYDVRPLICRVWGVIKRMSCHHGCLPDRWLSDHDFAALGQRVERLGGELLVTTPDGLAPHGGTFLDIVPNISREDADRYAEITRGLRALHGGRILGVAPSAEPTWINVDRHQEEEEP
jgi:Fe-S-cluster containining protein